MEDDRLSAATISSLRFDLRAGQADSHVVHQLLVQFCADAKASRSFDFEAVFFLADGLDAYLAAEKAGKPISLERALGLRRGKGRPRSDADIDLDVATAVLRRRLDEGMKAEAAVAFVASDMHISEGKVWEKWGRQRHNAFMQIRLERALDESPWTALEIERLKLIFEKDAWFVR